MSSPLAWNAFWPSSRTPTWDNDIIVFQTEADPSLGSDTEIELVSALAVSWWKGIQLLDAAGGRIGAEVNTFNAQHDMSVRFTAAQVASAVTLELGKAKAFGVHTWMYALTGLSNRLLPATRLVFTWLQDRDDWRDATFPALSFTGVNSWDPQAMQLSVNPGATFMGEFRVLNKCSIDWDPNTDFDLGFKIGSQNPQDNTVWGTGRIDIPTLVEVNNSTVVTQSFTAPASAGTVSFSWRMVQENVRWFGETVVITANVGGASPAKGTCVATALVATLPFAGLATGGPLDHLRALRAVLSDHPAGRELVDIYRDARVAEELVEVVSSDHELRQHALRLVFEGSAILGGAPADRRRSLANLSMDEVRRARRASDELLTFVKSVTPRCSPYSAKRLLVAERCLSEIRTQYLAPGLLAKRRI